MSEGKLLGEEDNSQMCKTCKHLKQLHPRPLYCEVHKIELPLYLGYCNDCELLYKKCKTYKCFRTDMIFHSCEHWELDVMKKKQSEQNYHREQMRYWQMYAPIRKQAEVIYKNAMEAIAGEKGTSA